ncbi:Voltage-gated hydrogen channel 1 [Chytriomyces hyalinus]|nr:Voltage-gated hydrogen channel 1 [Chytriomyces hyalinus]
MSETQPRPQRWADKLRAVMQSKMFHLSIIYLVLFDLLLVVIDLILSLYSSCIPDEAGHCKAQLHESKELHRGTEFLFWLSVTILSLFFIEIVASAVLFGLKHFKNPINVFDAIIITAAIVTEMYFHFSGLESSGSNAVIILRIFKLVRGMHAVAHAAAFQARQRVHQLEKINRHIAERARIMNRALSIAHSKIERLFETMAPMQSGETQSVKMEICEVYEHLKLVVSNGENGLEAELETLIQNEGFISDVTQASNVEAVSEKSEFIRNK